MKLIAVPIDFFHNAEKAAFFGRELAKIEKAKLILLHVYSVNYPVAETSFQEIQEIKKVKRSEAERILHIIKRKMSFESRVPIEIIALEGSVIDSILSFCKERCVNIIVMGTQGVNSITDRMFGNTTERIIEKSLCPVITIPETAKVRPIKRIVYATNYANDDIENLKEVIALASHFGSCIEVIHIANEKLSSYYDKTTMQRFIDKVRKEISYPNLSFHVLGGDIKETINKHIKENSADMLVLAAGQHTLLKKLRGKSVSKQLAQQINIPILVFHSNYSK